MKAADWLEAARPKTLPAALAPVIAGTAAAYGTGQVVWGAVFSCLSFSLLLQIGTNFANDYYDWKKGADGAQRQGPPRATSLGLVSPQTMRRATFTVFGLAFAAGLPLIYFGGWILLPIGILCILAGLAYTAGPYPLAYHGLGDLFVFLFFGLVAVNGTYYVQTGSLDWIPLGISIGIGALAANILVINNYRDRAEDRLTNKRTLVVQWGEHWAIRQFYFQGLVAALWPLLVVATGEIRFLWPVLILPWLILQARRLQAGPDGPNCNRMLAGTGQLLALYGLLWIPVFI